MSTSTGQDIKYAADLLRAGELVAMPTETVYGLAGNALNEDAVIRIFKAKERPFFDPLIAHTHSISEIRKYVAEIPARLLPLMERYMPGPLTVLLPRQRIIPDLVTSGLERVAFRIPQHDVALALLRSLDFPLAAPSANPFGYISPTTAAHVYAQMHDRIPYILDGGECRVGIESTIVGMEGDTVVVYRLGGLALEEIQSLVGAVQVATSSSSDPSAPGMLTSHYAPRKPLVIGDIPTLIQQYQGKKIAVISFAESYDVPYQYILSLGGSIDEAAKRLFAAMREMDGTDADIIIAKDLPEGGLGRAVNDRLKRASHPL
ncbi:MAG: threonylcarbamoyl-AMP synthase [Bacteroidetes bacterium]|nr:threonylcarbamoyl-AMP synthase [Bacteroidota bacterium]